MADEVKTETKTAQALDLKRFLSSMRLDSGAGEAVPMVQENLSVVREDVSDKDRFVSGMAVLLLNLDTTAGRFDKGNAQDQLRPGKNNRYQYFVEETYNRGR
jgi:type VI secretion system protein ImpC